MKMEDDDFYKDTVKHPITGAPTDMCSLLKDIGFKKIKAWLEENPEWRL